MNHISTVSFYACKDGICTLEATVCTVDSQTSIMFRPNTNVYNK